MKLTIKNLKHSEFNSHETNCFEATVYVDGVRAFIAHNEGHGGPNYYYPAAPAPGVKGDLLKAAEAWAASQPKIVCEDLDGFEYQPDLDHFVGELVTAELIRRDRMKAYRKGVAFVPENDEDRIEWYPLPKGLTAKDKAACRAKWEPQILAKHKGARLIEKDGTLRAA